MFATFVWIQFQCCGNQNYSDWFKIEWQSGSNNETAVPESCCKHMGKDCNSYDHVHNATSVKTYIYTEVGVLY